MTRRKESRYWTAPGLPALRDRQIAVLRSDAEEGLGFIEKLRALPNGELLSKDVPEPDDSPAVEAEIRDLQNAQLFWVSRRMTQVAVSTAPSLPEWTPLLALPSPQGLLCWERPAGMIRDSKTREFTYDAAQWKLSNGQLYIDAFTRDSLMPLHRRLSLVIDDPDQPRREEVDKLPTAVPEISTLAAAWLLMMQPRIVETRTLRNGAVGVPRPGRPDTPPVSIIDVRPTVRAPKDTAGSRGGQVDHDHQWWVTGHWRQQACGPGHSQRKPIWIDPHLKGPEDAPITETVKIWRSNR